MASWRGNADAITQNLRARGHSVARIDFDDELLPVWYKPKQLFHRHVLKQTSYTRHREPAMLRYYGREIGRKIAAAHVDVAVSLTAMPVPYLSASAPVVFWSDAPFDALVGFYPEFTALSEASKRNGTTMEQLAHARARRAIYSSHWGARAARAYGHADRIRIIPLGANIEVNETDDELLAAASRRSMDVIELAWIGMQWERKGGDVALQIVGELKKMGLQVRLRVAGVQPPRANHLPENVESLGFLSGADKRALLATSHFLVLPSVAECSPLVCSEAASVATPSLASRVGGISDIVRDSVTGQTFEVADAYAYASFIEQLSHDASRYIALCNGALRLYRNELNWQAATEDLEQVLIEALSS